MNIENQIENIYKDKIGKATISLFYSSASNDNNFIFASIISRIEKQATKTIPTMAVALNKSNENIVLLYNEDFVDSITHEELMGVLVHEALHITNLHFDRLGSKDRMIFNIATDMAINQLICQSGLQLPDDCVFPEGFKANNSGKTKIPMDFYREAEYYYDLIMENKEELLGPGSDNGGLKEGTLDDHSHWEEIAGNIEATEAAKSLVKKVAEEATRYGNNAGNYWLDVLAKKSKMNWKAELRAFFQANTYEVAFKTNRFDKRRIYHDNSEMIPAKHKSPHKHKIFVAIDVSGSITDDQISKFIGEILKMKESAKVTTLVFDTEIVQEIENITNKVTIKGRGGTDFQPIFDRLAKEKDERNVVILTDGYANTNLTIPPRTKAMWAVIQGGSKENLPGKVISLSNN